MLAAVFVVSFAMMLFQMAVFQVVSYLTNYAFAVYCIAICLMGLIAGGVASFQLSARLLRRPGLLFLLPLLAGASVGFTIADLLVLHTLDALHFSVGIFLVFTFSGWFIAHAFSRLSSFRVYAANMIGSGLGVVGAVLVIPAALEEGAILVSMLLPIAAAIAMLPWGGRRRLRAVVVTTCLIVTAAAAWLNRGGETLNFVRDARPNRFFPAVMSTKDETWLLSASSMSGRIDLTIPGRGRPTRTPDGSFATDVILTYINNRALDGVDRKSPEALFPDVRLPSGLYPDRQPSVLIVGPAAQGIVKPAKLLAGDRLTGVELNPATVELMTGELFEFSHRAYEGMELYVMDVRTFLKSAGRRFDIITLLNTHGWYIGYDPVPNYPFTIEAIRGYLDSLTDDGLIVIEELLYEDRTLAAIERELETFAQALTRRGDDDLGSHFATYAWRRERFEPKQWFLQVLVKKTPFDQAELASLERWVASLNTGELETKMLYVPGRADPDGIIAAALAKPRAPITDDAPFNVGTYLDAFMSGLDLVFVVLAIVGLGILALPARRFVQAARKARRSWLFMLYFAASGFAYMFFEIYIFQKNQLYIGSVGMSLVVTTAVMLITSGLGSLAAARMRASRQLLCLGLIPIGIGLTGWLGSWVAGSSALGFQAMGVRVLVVVLLLGPVSFLMGVPFAAGLEVARARLGDVFANYLFAINGVSASIGAVLSLNLSIAWGFTIVMLGSIGLYLLIFAIGMLTLSARA